jgi:LmbE family N-acetylglucosaminyl deacetylase
VTEEEHNDSGFRAGSEGGAGPDQKRENARTIIVSAHPDDAALSVGGSILSGFFERPIVLVSVFSRGATAPYHVGSERGQTLYNLMLAEDDAFAEAVELRLVPLEMIDAALGSAIGRDFIPARWVASVLRGRPPPNNSRLERTAGKLAEETSRVSRWSLMEKLARLDSDYSALRTKLASVIGESPGASLVSPLALGLHPDHVIVASICRSLEDEGVPTVYFEDLPYASSYGLPEIQRHVDRFAKGLVPTRVDVDAEMEAKIRNMKLYSTQVGPKQVRQVLAHARRLSGDGRAYERVWARGSLNR